MYVLRLNQSTMPLGWITLEEACKQYALGNVLFELGNIKRKFLGGHNHDGEQSTLEVSSIIGCKGKVVNQDSKIPLCNRWLFARDNHTCLYCGNVFKSCDLTLDHIVPRSWGGKKTWTNSATCCRRCNVKKADRTPEEAKMPLIAVPFKPNMYEQLYLRNDRILDDQKDYLSYQFSSKRNWLGETLVA